MDSRPGQGGFGAGTRGAAPRPCPWPPHRPQRAEAGASPTGAGRRYRAGGGGSAAVTQERSGAGSAAPRAARPSPWRGARRPGAAHACQGDILPRPPGCGGLCQPGRGFPSTFLRTGSPGGHGTRAPTRIGQELGARRRPGWSPEPRRTAHRREGPRATGPLAACSPALPGMGSAAGALPRAQPWQTGRPLKGLLGRPIPYPALRPLCPEHPAGLPSAPGVRGNIKIAPGGLRMWLHGGAQWWFSFWHSPKKIFFPCQP